MLKYFSENKNNSHNNISLNSSKYTLLICIKKNSLNCLKYLLDNVTTNKSIKFDINNLCIEEILIKDNVNIRKIIYNHPIHGKSFKLIKDYLVNLCGIHDSDLCLEFLTNTN